MQVITTWEDILGNPGGGYNALNALEDIGCNLDSSVDQIAEAMKRFCREVYTGEDAELDDNTALAAARHLLSEAEEVE
jgi:hypothetical protein